jgi:hypothetical protein
MAIPMQRAVPRMPVKREAEEIVPELAQMKVGESIFIPNAPGEAYPPVSSTQVAFYGLRTDKLFDAEYTDDGLQVWREE